MNIKTAYENYSTSHYDPNNINRSQKSIFVSLISYRDKNVINTLKSICENAKRPHNVYISVVVAYYEEDSNWINELKNTFKENKNINLTTTLVMNNNEKKSYFKLGELRKISESNYNKEDYYLTISSSSECDPYWDDILIKEYESLEHVINSKKFVLTADPRGYITHDFVVDGYVFYTNHKTQKSMQREELDNAKIPISGYIENILENNLNLSHLPEENDMDENKNIYFNNYITDLEPYRIFLENYGFVKFFNRNFYNDEFIALALGISSNFIFSSAKEYLKNNPSDIELIDKEDYDFWSYCNLIENDYKLFSLRFTPIYYMYDNNELFSEKRPQPKENINYNINDSIAYKMIIERINSFKNLDADKKNNIETSLSVDWNNRKFKIRKMHIKDNLIILINSFISLYNFSINENMLHWNKRGIL